MFSGNIFELESRALALDNAKTDDALKPCGSRHPVLASALPDSPAQAWLKKKLFQKQIYRYFLKTKRRKVFTSQILYIDQPASKWCSSSFRPTEQILAA